MLIIINIKKKNRYEQKILHGNGRQFSNLKNLLSGEIFTIDILRGQGQLILTLLVYQLIIHELSVSCPYFLFSYFQISLIQLYFIILETESQIYMNWAKSFFNRYPSISKGLFSGVLICSSDIVTQLWIQKKSQFDKKRNFQFIVLGLGWVAPWIQIWYTFILPKITNRLLTNLSKPKFVIGKLIIDTLGYPFVAYTGFYTIKAIFFNQDISKMDYQQQIKQKLIPTILLDMLLWLPVNFVNFWWVPAAWQGLYVGVFTFFFNIILSYISNKQLEYQTQYKKQIEQASKKGEPVHHHQQELAQKIIHTIHPKKIDFIA